MWLYPPTDAGTIFSPQLARSMQEAIANARGQKPYLRVSLKLDFNAALTRPPMVHARPGLYVWRMGDFFFK